MLEKISQETRFRKIFLTFTTISIGSGYNLYQRFIIKIIDFALNQFYTFSQKKYFNKTLIYRTNHNP